ncbi:hypothetical protein HHL19_20290 [Streptomyces sp. R302]|uniref:hypothetical protein n=1 Tax=unclassified Streptomyces TaxID=2593676 RepID=UPI00145D78CD|nr:MULTISPECIES: hypothetical protein [unclassified Streptomyces]NML50848.1 hypothetical protein [Streptomyces sp. R301]NML80942.1 hypothetical protein [Streptomyces sp. R302]
MTTAVHTGFASPVSLLWDWEQQGKGPLREFLVLGYTTDLPFLEAVAVPRARALGARVAILGDAGHALYEAVDVRLAGRGYLHGVAACHGAFHPKLALLLGDDACRVAIGSGNPTQSGWGTNDELWTVVTTDDGASHPLLADLADWLEQLPDAVALTSWWAEYLRHLAELLTVLHCEAPPTETEGPEVELAHNLRTPLIDRLPGTPVDELRLYAPFVDPSGELLRLLRERLTPGEITLGIQRRWTSYDSDGVRKAFDGHDAARVRELAETRMRHGKLVEWRVGDTWHALTGSPNLTRAALARAVGDATGGTAEGPARNCELAVIAHDTTPLLPDEGPVGPVQELTGSTVAPRDATDAPPALVLLGVREHGPLLEAVLGRRPAGAEVTVEISTDGGAPGSWHPIGPIPADRNTGTFPWTAAPGAAVRASCRLADGTYVESAAAFLYDAEGCAPRGAADTVPRLSGGYAVDDLFQDPAAARRFEQDIARLRELVVTDAGTPGTASPTPAECARTLGPELTEVAYGPLATDLPELTRIPAPRRWQLSEYATRDEEHEEYDGEDGSGSEYAAEEAAPEAGEGPLPDSAREQARAWMTRLARRLASEESDHPWSPPTTLLVTALHLQLLAAGAWDEDDYAWRTVTADLLHALGATDEDPAGPQRQRLDAVIAVCVSLLGLHGEFEGPEAEPVAAAAWRTGRGAVARAEPEHATDLYLPAGRRGAPVATETDVEALGKRARAVPDPMAEAHRALAAAHLGARHESGVWELTGEFANPQAACAKAVTVLAGLPDGQWPGPVLVRAHARGTGVPCFMAWSRPLLVRRRGRVWSSFRILAPATPYATFQNGAPRPTAQGAQAERDLGDLLAAAGLDPVSVFLHLQT